MSDASQSAVLAPVSVTASPSPAATTAAARLADRSGWPAFADIPTPRMVCLYAGNGSGTKLFQSYLDRHPQIYMIPGYPLMYFYPHWRRWEEELEANWTWPAIIDAFCVQHASVIDSRRIPGHEGLTTLGESRDRWLAIDEELFRAFLAHLLAGQPVAASTFLLAVHYAHAFCTGDDLMAKKVLVYHLHVHDYVARYLFADFPDMLTIGFVRDPRANLRGRYWSSAVAVDDAKLNRTDALVYRRRTYYFICEYLLDGLEVLRGLPADRTRMIRHEDLHERLEAVMRAVADFLGIDFADSLLGCTFGGLPWWGDPIYGAKPMNAANPAVVSLAWQKSLGAVDWFVLEGLFHDYCRKYGYRLYKYGADGLFDRIRLFLAILVPSAIERQVLRGYLSREGIVGFWRACVDEATGRVPLKDYGFNAYFRHKWSNRGLGLWKGRWYVRLLGAGFRLSRFGPLATPIRAVAAGCYVAANLARYLCCPFVHALWIARRWLLSWAAFGRLVRKDGVLPETLP